MKNASECDGCETGCSWCYAPEPDTCENCQGEIATPLVDETDPGIVYCSPGCRAEFVAAAERKVA